MVKYHQTGKYSNKHRGSSYQRPLVNNNTLQLYQQAKSLAQNVVIKKGGVSSQDQKWFQKLLTSGTISDKVSALTIKIKDNPQNCLQPLEQIMEIATNTKQRQESLKCLFTIKDIFLFLLSRNLSFSSFQEMIGKFQNPTKDQLISAFISHNLKKYLGSFIKLVEEKQQDPLVYVRRQSIIILVELYGTNQDATKQLLPTLINKFGDSDSRLIVNLTKLLTHALNKNPQMSLRVVKEIESFIYRPNLKPDAQFYALNFINQLNLARQEVGTIQHILKMFFTLFTKLMKVQDASTECSKILSQILRGINKVLPVAKEHKIDVQQLYSSKEDELYKLLHQSGNFKVRIQTLYFIFQTIPVNDRFYRALYELIQEPEIEQTKLQELFFDLLFVTLKQDEHLGRQKAFIKRLLQVAVRASPAFTITCLVFTSKMMDQVQGLKSMLNQAEEFFLEDDEEHFVDIDDDNSQAEVKKVESKKTQGYDPCKRDPKYCGAESASLWEIHSLTLSYHPVVREYAQSILKGGAVLNPKENPLHEHHLSTFLTGFIESTSRKTKRVSIQSKIVDETELDQIKINNSNRHVYKFLKNRFRDRVQKIEATGGQKTFDDEDEEDAYADELFEKELIKGEKEAYDVDDDESFQDESDEGDFPFGDEDDDIDEEDEMETTQPKKSKQKTAPLKKGVKTVQAKKKIKKFKN